MKTLFFLLLQIPFLSLASADVVLLLGQSKNLPLKGTGSVWIQDRSVLQATASGHQLVIKATHEGLTTVRVGDDMYRVQVLHPAKQEAFQELKKKLTSIVGLRAEVAEGDLLVTGRLYRLEDWIRLANFLKRSETTYQMRAEISQSLQNESQRYFADLLAEAKVAPQTVIFTPSPEVRVAGNEALFRKYLKILNPYGITVVKDENSLEIAPTVKVQITVAEIRRDMSLKYGIQWPASYSATLLANGGTVLDDAIFSAKAFESNGWGKILASPNIICRSGKEAEFLAGGEFPIKIMNYEIQDIVWKRYGILLRVRPKADAAGRISLSIETEVSTVDESRKVDDVPGILTNRVSSHFDLTRPQTIALSGLLKNEDGESSSGLPALSRLPILGALFSSKDYKENRTELVIFVRPSIMKENDDGGTLEHLSARKRSSL